MRSSDALRRGDREVVERLDVACRRRRRSSARPASARRRRPPRARAGSRRRPAPRRSPRASSRRRRRTARARPGRATRTWVSRQWSGSWASPVHSSAIPTPPVMPTRAVGDEDLAVRAVRQPAHRVGLRRAEARRRARPPSHHPLEDVALHLHPAHRVDDHVALDARPRALAQRVGDLVGDLAAPVGVGEQAERLLARRGSSRGSSGKIWSPLISSSTSLPQEIGAPVSASAARRKPGPAGSASPCSS